MTTGILLINLGTPQAANKAMVKNYLRQFLNDARVIDLPVIVRKILVNLLIIPLRTQQSTRAYQKIWTDAGSPLLVNSQQFQQALSRQLGNDYVIALGMRYGKPTLESAYAQLKHCSHIIVLPLFPQYASAATGSAIQNLCEIIAKQWNIPRVTIIDNFYAQPAFINSYANLISMAVSRESTFILFSYHGLPERHIDKSACKATCNRQDACPSITANNRNCYRAQCYATSALLAQKLQLTPEQYSTAFQSRLGKTPWIKPYTDRVLQQLIDKGIKNLVIACPSFVVDCLETLEEIGLRARKQWCELGGEQFQLIPCLNANADWVAAIANFLGDAVHVIRTT